MTLPVGRIVFWSVLAATPFALRLFAPRMRVSNVVSTAWNVLLTYRWHLALFGLILVEKNWVDSLNDPIRGVFGDNTYLIRDLEGDITYKLQVFFQSDLLTDILNVHYLWGYVFLNYFSVILFAYRDDRELANLAALNYSIIYILAVPFYIFFNVQVTGDAIPGMERLLYDAGPGFYSFFLAHDPLDNAFPSLHMAIPFGLIFVTFWAMRRRGYNLKNWEFRRYMYFLYANTAIFGFSILYLGIHWVTDIFGGLFVGLLGALIAEELQDDVFRMFHAIERRALKILRPITKAAEPAIRRIKARFL